MSRPATGSVREKRLADGTRAFELRFTAGGQRQAEVLHERRDCPCCGGGWDRPRAERELRNVLARVGAGVWTPRRMDESTDDGVTWRFDQYATDWLARWRSGALNEDRPDDATVALMRDWVLRRHVLPALGRLPLDDEHFTQSRLTGYKAELLATHDEIERVQAAGGVLLAAADGRPQRLSKRSIQIILRGLAQILDEAVEDGHLSVNHARSKRMRVRAPKPIRTWLQPDELSDLIDGAALIDAGGYSATTDRIVALRGEGRSVPSIAEAVGVTAPTVYYHLGKPRREAEGIGESRSLLMLLGYAGLRIREALALQARDVRLHAEPRRVDVLDAKTPTGVREVRGLPPLPAVTPHTLRHTYVSILLLVTDNVPYVMEQVGHDDETTTTRIYRHLIRQRQEHGAAFDTVVAQAREGFGAPHNRG